MKKIFIPLTTLIAFNSIAQEAESSDRKIIFKIETGSVSSRSFQLSDDTWNKNMSQFKLPDSLDTYRYRSNRPNVFSSSSYSTIGVDFTYKNDFLASKNIQSSLGFILGYGGESYISDMYYRRTSSPYDTLISSQTGAEYPVVQASYETYSRRYTSKSIMIGIGNHYATNPDKIVSFSTGLELIYSLSVSQQMAGSYVNVVTVEQESSNNDDYYSPYYGGQYGQQFTDQYGNSTPTTIYNTKAKGPMMNSFYARIPLEISFKLSNKYNYWGRSRIGVSLTPSVTFSILDKNTATQYSNWFGMNYRYTL